MKNNYNPDKKEPDKIAGSFGIANPVSGLPREVAEKIADSLGNGKDMGSWRTMSGEQFMKWWESCNPTAYQNVGDVGGYNGTKTSHD